MGTAEQNFYNDAFTRQGFGDDVRAVQELWLAGRRDEAADRVPLELGLARPTCSAPRPMVTDRLRRYRDAGITTLQAKLDGDPTTRLDTLAQLVDLVRQINPESSAVTK